MENEEKQTKVKALRERIFNGLKKEFGEYVISAPKEDRNDYIDLKKDGALLRVYVSVYGGYSSWDDTIHSRIELRPDPEGYLGQSSVKVPHKHTVNDLDSAIKRINNLFPKLIAAFAQARKEYAEGGTIVKSMKEKLEPLGFKFVDSTDKSADTSRTIERIFAKGKDWNEAKITGVYDIKTGKVTGIDIDGQIDLADFAKMADFLKGKLQVEPEEED